MVDDELLPQTTLSEVCWDETISYDSLSPQSPVLEEMVSSIFAETEVCIEKCMSEFIYAQTGPGVAGRPSKKDMLKGFVAKAKETAKKVTKTKEEHERAC